MIKQHDQAFIIAQSEHMAHNIDPPTASEGTEHKRGSIMIVRFVSFFFGGGVLFSDFFFFFSV